MLVYIIGKPRNQEELEAIWGHENIIFVDDTEEYREHKLYGKTPSMCIIDEYQVDAKTLIKNLPEPTISECADDSRRRSKGERRRNRRHRWSGQ